jgi:hypothetical protein
MNFNFNEARALREQRQALHTQACQLIGLETQTAETRSRFERSMNDVRTLGTRISIAENGAAGSGSHVPVNAAEELAFGRYLRGGLDMLDAVEKRSLRRETVSGRELMVIIMITGDFLGMSLPTDNVRPSPTPNAWRVSSLTIAGAFMGISELLFCTAVLAIGKFRLGFGIESLQTLAFLLIVFGNQATMYTNRTRQRLWSRRPSSLLVLSSVADVLIASAMAYRGIAMAPLPFLVMGGMFAGVVVFAFMVDIVKVPVFNRLKIV